MKVTRPLLRYHGGKFMLRHWIVDSFTPHRIYSEAYGGAGTILLAKPRSFAEVYNDLDGDVVRLFRVVRDPAKKDRLKELLRFTPFAREEYELARVANLDQVDDDLEAARLLVLRSFLSHGSEGTRGSSTGFRARSWGSHRAAPNDWMAYPYCLDAICDRLQGVAIENRPALEILNSSDGPATLHYVDPPYLPDTRSRIRGYNHEMTEQDHVDLASCLKGLAGAVFLSGYHHPLYDELYANWWRKEKDTFADGAEPRTEVLWSNRPLTGQTSIDSLLT